MSLGTYKKYKDSGIKWLGAVPEQWEIKRNKQIFFEIGDVKTTGNEMLLTVSHITGVTPRSEKNVNMFLAESMEAYKRVREGDLIVNTMWAWMGALGISNYNGICSPAYNIYRQRKKVNSNPKYFGYLFSTRNFVLEMTRRSKGIVESRLRLYPRDFYGIEICFPSGLEQTQIANYLDCKTQAIDNKVELLRQKIDKYKELRKSIINHTITKGLNPNTEFKDSGIEWIGKVPKHWEEKRLKDIGSLYSGLSGKSGDDFNQDENADNKGFLTFTNIASNTYIDIGNFGNVIINKGEKQNKIRKQDIFFLMSSEGYEDLGKAALLIDDIPETYLNSFCKGFRITNKQVLPKYLNWMLFASVFRERLLVQGKGFTRINLKMEKINDFEIILPTQDEQKEIAHFLDTKTNLIDSIIANIEKQIAGLAELRKTLINDVVTGKLKVSEDS